MAENQAEEEDDESFGDFKFVPYQNQTVLSNQIDRPDDEDWGEFVLHSDQVNGGFELSNGNSTSPFASKPSETSKPFALFGVSADHMGKHGFRETELSWVESESSPSGSDKTQWVNPREALPLSIFGEEEKEEESVASDSTFTHSYNFFSSKSGDSVGKGGGLGSNLGVGINDLIANLYNQIPQIKNENGLNSNHFGENTNSSCNFSPFEVGDFNRDAKGVNLDSNRLNSNQVDGDENGEDDDGGWEFKGAESEIHASSKVAANGTAENSFGFDYIEHGPGKLLGQSNGVSEKAGQWNIGFEFNSIHESPGTITPDSNSTNKWKDITNGFILDKESFWESKADVLPNQGSKNSSVPEVADRNAASLEALTVDGKGPHVSCNSSLVPDNTPHNSVEWDFGFDFNHSTVVENANLFDSHPDNHREKNVTGFGSSPTNKSGKSYFWEFKDAFTESESKLEVSAISDGSQVDSLEHITNCEIESNGENSENPRESLPLSIFGDEKLETHDPFVQQDISTCTPTSYASSAKVPRSSLSINDLMLLYSQAEQKTSTDHAPKAIENGIHDVPKMDSCGDDDFDDGSWELKDASSGTTLYSQEEYNDFANHSPKESKTDMNSSQMVSGPDLVSDSDDTWNCKEATFLEPAHDQVSVNCCVDSAKQLHAKLELLDYMDLYGKLKDELCDAALFHLESLKEAQSAAAHSGEDAKANALNEDIQLLSDTLHKDNIISKEYQSDNHSPRDMCLDKLLELLWDPKFKVIECEYRLSSKLLFAKKDMISTIELLKHAASTLKILHLRSREEQLHYLDAWSKIISVCFQELNHGASIWNKSLKDNVHDQILSKPKGKQFIHALGEIYRAVQIIGASSKLYKSWIILGPEYFETALLQLKECSAIWSNSGLEEALGSVSDPISFQHAGTSRALLESIKYIQDIDEHTLHNYIVSGVEPNCRLSALPAEVVPGMKMVEWDGKHYFLTLANLWANLISPDPPKL